MGMGMFSSSSYDKEPVKTVYVVNHTVAQPTVRGNQIRNPDLTKYRCLHISKYGDFKVVKAQYFNATNYEGLKIIVVKDWDGKVTLDPHFSLMSPYTIKARFEPTKEGWLAANRYAEELSKI